MAILANEFGKELLDKMGIDSSNVTEFYLILKAGSVAEITIKRFVTDSETETIKSFMENYLIIPKVGSQL